MIWLNKIIRPSILNLKPYSSARSITNLMDNFDLSNTPKSNESKTSEAMVYLDANESAYTPELEINANLDSTLNRYPNPQPASLLKRFSEIYKVNTNNILLTRGSDEAIDLLTRAVCEPKEDSILIMPPTYGMYQVSADIQDCKTIMVPLKLRTTEELNDKLKSLEKVFTKKVSKTKWKIDLDSINEKLSNNKNIKIIYICSPNNPTGTVFSKIDIQSILETLSPRTILVVDQAYCEFSPESSVTELLTSYPQLVILRTLSKAWGLAGIRMGVLLGHSDLISVMQKVRAPYPIPTPVIEITENAISNKGLENMRFQVKKTLNERAYLINELSKLDIVIQIYQSETNFLLVEFKDVSIVMKSLIENMIVLRDRSSQIKNTIRITVGSEIENKKLIKCLIEINNTHNIKKNNSNKTSEPI